MGKQADPSETVDYEELAREVMGLVPLLHRHPSPDGHRPTLAHPPHGIHCPDDAGSAPSFPHLPHPKLPGDLMDATRGVPIVLGLLARQGGQSSPGALAACSGLSKGRISNIVTALETKGYVEKRASDSDARGVVVSLTEKGRSVTDAHEQAVLRRTAWMLQRLGPEDARDGVRVLKHLAELAQDQHLPQKEGR